MNSPLALRLLACLPTTAPDDNEEDDYRQYAGGNADHHYVHFLAPLVHFLFYPGCPGILRYFMLGKSCRISAITAGPKITTSNAGKINSNRAGTIFTLVFALISSARCLRFVRNSSE